METHSITIINNQIPYIIHYWPWVSPMAEKSWKNPLIASPFPHFAKPRRAAHGPLADGLLQPTADGGAGRQAKKIPNGAERTWPGKSGLGEAAGITQKKSAGITQVLPGGIHQKTHGVCRNEWMLLKPLVKSVYLNDVKQRHASTNHSLYLTEEVVLGDALDSWFLKQPTWADSKWSRTIIIYTTQYIGDYHNRSLAIHHNHDSWSSSISYPFLVYRSRMITNHIIYIIIYIYSMSRIRISLLYG